MNFNLIKYLVSSNALVTQLDTIKITKETIYIDSYKCHLLSLQVDNKE